MTVPLILVPKQVFACTISSFPFMINVAKNCLEVAVSETTSLQFRTIVPLWDTIFTTFNTFPHCQLQYSLLSFSRAVAEGACAPAAIQPGAQTSTVVIQADIEAPHLNAKNRT